MGLSTGISVPQPCKGVATVTTNQQTTVLVWPRSELHELLNSQPQLAAGFYAAVAADVMKKMRQGDAYSDEEGEAHRATQHELWRNRYASVLGAVLESGQVTPQQRAQLLAFREIHRLEDGEHETLLLTNGWTAAQYEDGENASVLRRVESAAKEKNMQQRQQSIDTLIAGHGGLPAEYHAGAAVSSPQPEPLPLRRDSDSRNMAPKSGMWAPSAKAPLTLWDSRKGAVVAVQERLNAFFGTEALSCDGHYGPLTQQVP